MSSDDRLQSADPVRPDRVGRDGYPSLLHALRTTFGENAPSTVAVLGEPDVLRRKTLAVFCSIRCPGRLILQTYDLAQALRDAGVTVISGFHSPMERECLALLLRGKQPIVVCPARDIEKLRVPVEWRPALKERRLLVLSPFESRDRRATAELALKRNRFVAALADEVFIAYAAPGSRTEHFAQELVSWGKPLLTLDGPENAALVALGARVVTPAAIRARAPSPESHPRRSSGPVPLPLVD